MKRIASSWLMNKIRKIYIPQMTIFEKLKLDANAGDRCNQTYLENTSKVVFRTMPLAEYYPL